MTNTKKSVKTTVKKSNNARKTTVNTVKPVSSIQCLNAQTCEQLTLSIKNRIEKTIQVKPAIVKDTLKALKELSNNPQSVMKGIEIISQLRGIEPVQFTSELVSDLAITDDKNPRFIAQKVINKLFVTLSNIGAKNITGDNFVFGFLSGLLHETEYNTNLAYNYLSANTVNDKIESERIRKNGGYSYQKSTATTQTSQMRQLARIFGLSNTVKRKRNDCFTLNPNARQILESLLGYQS